MADDIVQVIQDAREDATSLSEFIYYPANTMVERRLAPSIHTLNYYLDYLHGLELIYSQPTGTVTVNGEEIKTVRQAINDSVDSVVLGDYQTQLEGRVSLNEGNISNIETSIENLPIVDGKVPVSQVSISSGVNQEDKNTGYDGFIEDQELKNIGYDKQAYDTGITATSKFGGLPQPLSEKLKNTLDISDFDIVADGITDDSAAMTALDTRINGKTINLLGRSIVVDTVPTNNSYQNGAFIVGGISYPINKLDDYFVSHSSVIIGANTPKPAVDYTGMVIAIGNGAMTNRVNARSSIAIGTRALNDMEAGRYNIAIGLESQFHCKSDDNGTGTGTRNVSIGDNSLRFNVLGRGNIAMGRNTAQAIENASNNTAIGSGAMAGIGSLKFKNLSDIYNQTPVKSNNAVAVGVNALTLGGDSGAVAVGAYALESGRGKTQQSTAVGFQALNILGAVEGVNGGTLVPLNTTATYVMTASNVTFNVTVANAVVGDYLYVRFDTGIPIYGSTSYRDPQYYKITAISTGSITVAEPHGVIASGNAFIDTLEDISLVPARCDTNTAIGFQAMAEAKVGSNNNAMGYFALRKNNASGNVAIGDFSLTNLTVKRETYNTAVGYAALRTNVDGTPLTDRYNCAGLGFDTRVSADNQVQLGNSNTTTYAFGAVQDRSDARDKIIEGDITDAHINFFNDVEFKRYRLDYRDDYIEIDDDGNVTKLDKDGSKARKREHVGVIAQQVEEAMRAHNIDFAGLQHHSQNGGYDIYTVGYQEFIPILGEIVQRQQKQIDELIALIKK